MSYWKDVDCLRIYLVSLRGILAFQALVLVTNLPTAKKTPVPSYYFLFFAESVHARLLVNCDARSRKSVTCRCLQNSYVNWFCEFAWMQNHSLPSSWGVLTLSSTLEKLSDSDLSFREYSWSVCYRLYRIALAVHSINDQEDLILVAHPA